jgi:putative redox protein
MYSTSFLTGKRRLITDNGRGKSIIQDLPVAKGGTDQGPTPYELLAMALSGCVAIIYQGIADNSNVPLDFLNVKVECITPEGEKTFTEATVDVEIQSTADKARLHRILEKTISTCPVGVVFRNAGIQLKERLILK